MNVAKYVYIVHSDINENNIYAEFEKEEEAIEYAKRHKDELTYVDKVEVALDEAGDITEIFDERTIWVYDEEDDYEEDEDSEGWSVCVVTPDDGDSDWEYFDSEYEARDYFNNYTSYESGREVEVQLYGPDGMEDSYTIEADEDLDESVKYDELVETLEENEDIVECKECFELFPKQDCIKIEIGYVCPECGKVHDCCSSKESEVKIDSIPDVVIADEDTFKVDFPELERIDCENDMVPEEPTPEVENDPISEPECVGPECEAPVEAPVTKEETITKLVVDEHEAIDGYEKAKIEIEANSELDEEEKEEILDTIEHIKEEEIEHIEELEELVDEVEETKAEESEVLNESKDGLKTWDCWFDGDYLGTVKAKDEQSAYDEMCDTWPDYHYGLYDGVAEVTEVEEDSLEEHVNEEHPAIESDQELEGTDNAVVDCKLYDIITHSEDEKPLDEELESITDLEILEVDNKLVEVIKKEITKWGSSPFDVGIATGGDGPYYDGTLILDLRYENGIYFAETYIDCGDGPMEDPEFIDEVGEHGSLESLLQALEKDGWIKLITTNSTNNLKEEYVAPGSREFENLGETMYVALRLLYLNMKTEADAVDIIQDARRFGYEPEEIEVLEDLISFVFEHFYNNIESAAEFKRNIIKGWQVSQINKVDEKAKRELYGIISRFSRTKTKKQELLFQAINTLVLEFLY